MAFVDVDDERREADTFGIGVGNCIPLALAFAFDIAVAVVVFGACMASTIE